MAEQTVTIVYDDETNTLSSQSGAPGFTLPTGTQIALGSVDIHQAAEPYVSEWFNDLKQVGDTPMRFLLRRIYTEAARHRARKLLSAYAQAVGQGQALDDYQQQVDADLSAAIAALETILP